MRRFILKIIFCLMLQAGLSSLAWAQAGPWGIAWEAGSLYTGGPALTSFLRQAGERNQDPKLTYEVLQNAHRLQSRGLPTEPYLLKANEGLAKGVPPSRLATGLGRTERQTELSGRLVDRAIARGAIVDSPEARRRTVQEFQWALVNGTPPRKLIQISDEFTPGSGKNQGIGQIGRSVRQYTLQEAPVRRGKSARAKSQKGEKPATGKTHDPKKSKEKGAKGKADSQMKPSHSKQKPETKHQPETKHKSETKHKPEARHKPEKSNMPVKSDKSRSSSEKNHQNHKKSNNSNRLNISGPSKSHAPAGSKGKGKGKGK